MSDVDNSRKRSHSSPSTDDPEVMGAIYEPPPATARPKKSILKKPSVDPKPALPPAEHPYHHDLDMQYFQEVEQRFILAGILDRSPTIRKHLLAIPLTAKEQFRILFGEILNDKQKKAVQNAVNKARHRKEHVDIDKIIELQPSMMKQFNVKCEQMQLGEKSIRKHFPDVWIRYTKECEIVKDHRKQLAAVEQLECLSSSGLGP